LQASSFLLRSRLDFLFYGTHVPTETDLTGEGT
jgi:hypothetical protein